MRMSSFQAGENSHDLWIPDQRSVDRSGQSGIETMELKDVDANSTVAKLKTSDESFQCGSNYISFHDITYEVKNRGCSLKKKPNKVVLDSVSGLLMSGLNAIMGPTGSGKTSLLDILADRRSSSMISGHVLVNGRNKPPNFKSMVGYVVQDDVVLGTLTVRENLQFSAALRLPSHTTLKQRRERVEKVIKELGLQSCAGTKVGNEFIRGVSGGERKRTNIGMELIIEPQILFLDEPTTGLDASTAVSVVRLLKKLSEVNERIVTMSIHQPRYSIFKLFDNLTLLSEGQIVYFGTSARSLTYFDELGYQCENHENPADFFLDVLNRNTDLAEEDIPKEKDVKLGEMYRASDDYKKLRRVIDPVLNSKDQEDVVRRQCFNKYATSIFWQLLLISGRSFVNLIRNPGTSIIQYITIIFFAIVIGGIYFQLGTEAPGFQDRVGVFFFIATNQAFGSLSAIDLFIKQRAIFIHEYASGYYGVFPFFLAKVTIDIVIFRFFPNVLFALITYFMVGFQLAADKFFIYLLVITLINVSAVSIAFCLSAFTRVAAIANLLIAIAFVVSMLFGGLLISLQSLPDWISWMRFLSFVRYGIEALSINEMEGLSFKCFKNNQSMMAMNDENCTFDGLLRLDELGFKPDWLWYDVLALIIFSLLFLTAAYIILLLIKKEK